MSDRLPEARLAPRRSPLKALGRTVKDFVLGAFAGAVCVFLLRLVMS